MVLIFVCILALLILEILRELERGKKVVRPSVGFCPGCSGPVEEGWLICPRCRHLLRHRCPGCGEQKSLLHRFCTRCGARDQGELS